MKEKQETNIQKEDNLMEQRLGPEDGCMFRCSAIPAYEDLQGNIHIIANGIDAVIK